VTAIAFTGNVVAGRLKNTAGVAGVDAESADAAAHDEWLLDEAPEETFPACDPIAPSTVG
jgi:hypothetical protein